MHPSGNPYFQRANAPPLPGVAMAGRMDGHNGGPSANYQYFFPTGSDGRPTSLATSESTGTNASQYSNPHGLPFENFKAASTPVSSDSDWSNFPTDGGFVPVELYRSLQAHYNETQRENVNLLKERALLEAKNSVLKEAYDHLVERIPVAVIQPSVLKREDYPNITFWFRHEYLAALADDKITSIDDAPINAQPEYEADAHDDDANGEDIASVQGQSGGTSKSKRGKGRASQGQNVKMRYLQHENGDIIDGWRASDIRRYARSIFVGFALQGKTFSSWVEGVDAGSRTTFYRDMVARFPEVGLCELDWKSEQIASEIYSQWRSNWITKQEAEKTKGKIPSKRLVEGSLKDLSQKKKKISESLDESVAMELLPADISNSGPQVNSIAADGPGRPAQATGETAMADSVAIPFAKARPHYQFSIDKPFPAAPLHLHPPFLTPNPMHPGPAQGSSNVALHQTQNDHSLNENVQRPLKRPNKMRVNKHSVTPRNLCAKEWVEQHHGTVDEFAAYFSALPTEELEVRFTKSSSLMFF
ncbi:hypothetical protein HYPSUDRAFT_208793 [Hypholoma sublateritium FD-334 SS-4]|uniref:Uncharacterized protein n=1 Tax=Hypholoma sublateritium (strain FD-334 SS-4) TaxID=945553 RepID=A0A0D2KI94_HYPSF|nr:hypothetical protein HYPSUDRAFT_208793 [Hypholoma sublateritium FD-334 SS-4]